MSHSLRSVVPALRCPCAPLSLRSVVPYVSICLMASLMLAAPDAHAGSYVGAYKAQVVVPNTNPAVYQDSTTLSPYSQGTSYQVNGYTGTNPNDPAKRTFANVPDTSAGDGSYQGGSSGDGVNGTKSDCSGAIQTSWTWVPGQNQTMTTDPPPSQVIIMQTCSVSVGLGKPGGSGSYNDGLGQSGTASFNPPTSTGGSASGTTYFIHPGGATVSLLPFNASASVSNAPSSVSLSYKATIYPVTVDLQGVTLISGGYQVLTGQQVTATLNLHGAPLSLNVLVAPAVPPVVWTVGGSTFKSYPWNQPTCHVVSLAASDETGTAVSFFTKKDRDAITVHFAGDLKVPAGALPQPTLHLAADASALMSVKPTLTAWIITPGYVSQQGAGSGTTFGLYGVAGSQDITQGETWKNVTIIDPPWLQRRISLFCTNPHRQPHIAAAISPYGPSECT